MPLPLACIHALATLLALAAPAAGAARQAPAAFPDAMRGIWGYTAEACVNEADDGRVEVKAGSVTFFASACVLRRFHSGADGAITGHGQCRGEGETTVEPGSVTLRLEAPGRLLIALEGAEGITYQRCMRPLPVR